MRRTERTWTWAARDINALLIAGGLALAAWPILHGDPYSLRLMTLTGIYALAAIGYQFVFGHVGALSLAQGAFFGMGAYVAGILSAKAGLDFALTFPAAAFAAGLLAAAVALPVLRLGSHYFALATLGIGQVVLLVAVNWEDVTGGANGIAGIPELSLLGLAVTRGWPLLLLVWALVLAGALAARHITSGLAGPRLTLMREQPMAAEAAGIDIRRLRFAAFLLSAIYGGAAGALQVHTVRVVSPEVLEFPVMVSLLAIAVVGGRTSIAGAIPGAFLLVHLPEWFRPLQKYYLLAYGAALLAMIVAAPWGLIGALKLARRRWLPEAEPPLPEPIPLPGNRAPGMLEIEGVVRHFGGVRAVDGVDLKVAPGEAVGLIGANGSGKSTLVNLVAGAEKPDAGRILWRSQNIDGSSPVCVARAGIGRTFQSLKLVDDMSVLDNVAAGDFAGASLADTRGAAMHLLKQLGLEAVAWRLCGALPPGLRRRVEIARALIAGPSLLLLDEPAAGLTGGEREALAAVLVDLNASGMTLVVVEHDLEFLARFATRLVCMDGGRVIADGLPQDIRNDPAVIASWLGGPPAERTQDG
jgi:branched-chain amino acid transport system permease protein